MSMLTYGLSSHDELRVFDGESACVVVYVDDHCHMIYCSNVAKCGYDVLRFFHYDGLMTLVSDFISLKEYCLKEAGRPGFRNVSNEKGLLRMQPDTYLGGFVSLDISEGDIPGKTHVSMDCWSEQEIMRVFDEVEAYAKKFRDRRVSRCVDIVDKIGEICKINGYPFDYPFRSDVQPASADIGKKRGGGFIGWLSGLFR